MQSKHYRETIYRAIAATKTLDPMDISRHYGYSAQFVVSNIVGSISAVAKLQCSNDGSTWDDISGATKTLSAAGGQMINLDALHYRFIRVVLTYTSGTADINVCEMTKGS